MTPLMDMPPNFMAHQFADTPPTHAVDIEGLRRQHSHVQQQQSPQTHSIAGSPQVESMEMMSSDRPIKQLSELDLELSKLIPKGGGQQQSGPQQATSQQQGQVKLYSEVVRQQSITVTTNEPQNVCITTTGDEVSSTKVNEEQPQGSGNTLAAPPPLVRKVSRFQVSTVVEQQQIQQLQQQQNQVEEKTVLITQNNATPTQQATQSTVTIQQSQQQTQTQQQVNDTNIVYQQQMSKGRGLLIGHVKFKEGSKGWRRKERILINLFNNLWTLSLQTPLQSLFSSNSRTTTMSHHNPRSKCPT